MKQTGLTLIELMISMVLGLMLLAGVSSLFQANKQTFQSNQSLSQIQESVRTTFGILSRELRQTGYTKCGNGNNVASILNSTANENLYKWRGIYGVDKNVALAPIVTGTGVGERVADTSAILVQGLQELGYSVAKHDTTGQFILNGSTMPFQVNDILMVCDYSQASIFQVNAVSGNKLSYTKASANPGNCQLGLGLPGGCANTPFYIAYSPNSSIERLVSSIWYIGNNGRTEEGGRSLYRMRLANQGQVLTEEVVAGITGLDIDYHLKDKNSWNTAAEVTAITNGWQQVDGLKLRLSVISANSNVGGNRNDGRLQRTFTQTIALRNR